VAVVVAGQEVAPPQIVWEDREVVPGLVVTGFITPIKSLHLCM
jgi:hypothetical protein